MGLFIAEGPKVVMDLLNSRKFVCKEIFALQDWIAVHKRSLDILKDTAITELVDFELKKISSLSTAHSVVAIFEKRKPNPGIETNGKIVLALDTIQDPGNLGTIIRIADWFGVQQLVCSPDCADAYAPKVVQGSMGSIARVQLLYTPLAAFIHENPGLKLYAATLGGQPLAEAGKLTEGMLVIGNESKGVSREILAAATRQFTIPRVGKAESLNAAVATGILLSHLI